jgi:hypothetical protein
MVTVSPVKNSCLTAGRLPAYLQIVAVADITNFYDKMLSITNHIAGRTVVLRIILREIYL